MRLIAAGLSYKTAPLELLERVAYTHDRLPDGLRALRAQASLAEAVILSTCHRTELYGVTAGDPREAQQQMARFLGSFHVVREAELLPHLCFYEDGGVAQHLFAVAAGLESMVLGEPQVLGQVRAALGEALGCGTVGKILSRLFRAAVRVGKRARTETGIARTPLSISSLAVSLAEQVLGSLCGKEALIVGSGEMSVLAARLLFKRGIQKLKVTSRRYERALSFAGSLQGEAVPWEALPEALQQADLVISSTAAPHAVISAEMIRQAMRRRRRPLILIDIAMPRDIEPEAGKIANVYLYNLDALQAVVEKNGQQRAREIPSVQAIIEEEVHDFMEWLQTLRAIPTLKALRDRAEQIRTQELKRALQRLGPISEREKQIIEQLSSRIVKKLLHEPTVRLKQEGSRNGSLEQLARELFGLKEEP